MWLTELIKELPRAGMWGCLLLVLSCGIVTSAGAQNPPQNPLNRLFKNLDNQIRGADADEAEDENGRLGRDAFDVRTPQNPDHLRRLAQAERLIRDERWQDAVEVLQFLLDQPQDALRPSGSNWGSLRGRVNELLKQLPEAGQRSYESRFGAEADALYQAGIDEADEAILIDVVRRFRHLPAGTRARQALISRWQGRGDFNSARELAEQLNADRPTTTAAIQVAYCWELLQQRSKAAELLGQTLGWQTALGIAPSTAPGAWLDSLQRKGETPQSQPPTPFGEPLLLPTWAKSRIERFKIEEQVTLLIRDLKDGHRGIRPVATPVFVRDLIIYQDFSGLKARKRSTGELVWQDFSPHSVESRLMSPFGSVHDLDAFEEVQEYDLSQLDLHPLGTVLFRDGVSSALAAYDGRLYSVERQDPLATLSLSYYWQREGTETTRPDWSVNELVCRDAATGRRLWTVGGPQIEPAFSRPLADAYFCGAPVLFEDQLLVIAELDAEMHLFGLAPRTGEVLWTQLIASSGRPLEEDPIRRMWRCQPTVTDGQIICPTSSGWLISLDSHTRQLKWAYRYPPHGENRRHGMQRGYNVNSVQPLNKRWGPSQPLVDGDRILVMPPELPDDHNSMQPMLVCLDLQGELVWQQAKQDSLYVAGIHDHRVILVGNSQVKAIDLADGAPIWDTNVPVELGMTCGTGAAIGDEYLLPVGEQHLLRLSLKSGEILQTLSLVDRQSATLGNLSVHAGQLYSLSPRLLSAFPSVADEQRAWDQLGALAPERILRETQMFLSQQADAEALKALDRVPADKREDWKPADRRQARDLEWDLLVRLMSAPSGHDFSLLPRLTSLAESTAEKTFVQRQRATQLVAAGRPLEGAKILFELLLQAPPIMVHLASQDVRLDASCGGQLDALFTALPEDQRDEFDELVATAIGGMSPDDAALQDRVANALSFHPSGNALQLQLAKQAAEEGELTAAGIRYRRVVTSGSPDQRLRALRELAELYAHQELPRAAMAVWRELSRRTDVPTHGADGKAVADLVQQAEAELSGQLPMVGDDWEAVWRTKPLIASLTAGERSPGPYQLMHSGQDESVTSQWRFLYRTEQQRLTIEETATGQLLWSLPLRALAEDGNATNIGVAGDGVSTIVLHRGVVHALGLHDRRLLWQFVPDLRDEGPRNLRPAIRSRNINMKSAASLLAVYGARASGQNGFVLGANDSVVVLQLRDLVVLDALTGEILWTERTPNSSARVVVRDDTLIQVDEQGRERLQRARDGSYIDDAESELALSRAFQIRGSQVIRLDTNQDEGALGYEFSCRPLAGDADLWRHAFPKTTTYSLVDHDHVAILSADGALSLLSLSDGMLVEIGTLPESVLAEKRRLTVLSDARRLYVVVEHGRALPMYAQTTSLPLNGFLLVFDRKGGLLWQRASREFPAAHVGAGAPPPPENEAPGQPFVLALSDFERSPALVLLSEFTNPRPNGLSTRQLQVLCLDKQTGAVLFNWQRPTEEAGFHNIRFDQRRGQLEFESSSYRLRLRAE